jgi:hypothetical protein
VGNLLIHVQGVRHRRSRPAHTIALVATASRFWERHYYDNDYHTLLTTMLASVGTVTEPTNYTKLSKKITARADNLANLSHITQ